MHITVPFFLLSQTHKQARIYIYIYVEREEITCVKKKSVNEDSCTERTCLMKQKIDIILIILYFDSNRTLSQREYCSGLPLNIIF